MPPAIRIEGLWKEYAIGRRGPGETFREMLVASISRLGRPSRPADTFWALNDINLEIASGEIVGIIGANGAGKSTLLKVLSRITEPSRGRVEIRGGVASLLEVGTGFHSELSGRENIFLNGAILGMRRREIERKFDEIVAFAEVEQFLDTPVKHYSSGMYVRLAFAVAAHLETDILLVDEVLAVGDAAFQKKCLGTMRSVASQQGRTVVLVSHNMNAVESLCGSVVLLERGRVVTQTRQVRTVIDRYLGFGGDAAAASTWKNPGSDFDHPACQPLSFGVVDADGRPLVAPARNDQDLAVVICADIRRADPALNLGFALYNQDAGLLFWSLTTDGPEPQWPRLERGVREFRCALPKRLLNEGVYRVELMATLHHRDWLVSPGENSPAVHFEIRGGLSDSPYWHAGRAGALAPVLTWERTA